MNNEEIKNNNEPVEKTYTAPTIMPAVDIYDKDQILTVIADMPGVDGKTLKIDFKDGILTIEGSVSEPEYKQYRALFTEYKIVNYHRSFSVPEEIDVEKIEATVKNGVVTIRLPRSPKPKARKIPVAVE